MNQEITEPAVFKRALVPPKKYVERKYGDRLRDGHWAEIAARKVVSHINDFLETAKVQAQPASAQQTLNNE